MRRLSQIILATLLLLPFSSQINPAEHQKQKPKSLYQEETEQSFSLDNGYRLQLVRLPLSSNIVHSINLPESFREIRILKPGSKSPPIVLDSYQGKASLTDPKIRGKDLNVGIIDYRGRTNALRYTLQDKPLSKKAP